MKKKYDTIFDNINSLDIYYQPMQIGLSDKARRKELAEYLADAFLFFFSTFEVHEKYQSVLTKQLYAQMLADRVSEAVAKVTGIDSYMSDHIRVMSKQVVDTTFDKVSNVKVKDAPKEPSEIPLLSLSSNVQTPESNSKFHKKPLNSVNQNQNNNSGGSLNNNTDSTEDGDYWLSYRRAEDIAKSEANTFLNYTDYVEAKASGKTKKTWLTMLDDKVRLTHSEVEGQTIDIDALFYVGDSLMRFPHDLSESPNPKEVIGCRCSVQYS